MKKKINLNPIQDGAWSYKPVQVLPGSVYLGTTQNGGISVNPWAKFIEDIESIKIDVNQQLLECETGKALYIYRRGVLDQFYVQRFESKNRVYKNIRGATKLICAEAELWNNLHELSQEMSLLICMPHSLPVPTRLSQLIYERALTLFIVPRIKLFDTMTEFKKLWQSQNRNLQLLLNPFSKHEEPHTFQFIAAAIELAEQDTPFKDRYYIPMVRSRMALIKELRERNPRMIVNGKPQNQGRKKTKG